MYSAVIESFITLQSVWSIWPANTLLAGVSKSPRKETAAGSRRKPFSDAGTVEASVVPLNPPTSEGPTWPFSTQG